MISGREGEQRYLAQTFNAKKAQFITVYGRRRVGKTYLNEEFFKKKKCTFFQVTGLQNGLMKDQLYNFAEALSATFFHNAPIGSLKNWSEAFKILRQQIMESDEKVVVFLDELPWLATRKPGLLKVIEHDWNRYFSKLPKLIYRMIDGLKNR